MGHNSTTSTDDLLFPAHVQQWAEELQHMASAPHTANEASLEHYNEIEVEVIVGGRRCFEEDESVEFGVHKFKNKKAHRVACLLASARLISTLSSPPPSPSPSRPRSQSP
eukprot:2540790-Rhodomonas_salina.1